MLPALAGLVRAPLLTAGYGLGSVSPPVPRSTPRVSLGAPDKARLLCSAKQSLVAGEEQARFPRAAVAPGFSSGGLQVGNLKGAVKASVKHPAEVPAAGKTEETTRVCMKPIQVQKT